MICLMCVDFVKPAVIHTVGLEMSTIASFYRELACLSSSYGGRYGTVKADTRWLWMFSLAEWLRVPCLPARPPLKGVTTYA